MTQRFPELAVTARQQQGFYFPDQTIDKVFDHRFSRSQLKPKGQVPGAAPHRRDVIALYADGDGKQWVLKKLDTDAQSSMGEVRRLAKLRGSPYVVPMRRIFAEDNHVGGRDLWLQMPFFERGSLASWVSKIQSQVQGELRGQGKVTPDTLKAIVATFRQMCEAVAFCHQRGDPSVIGG